MTAEPAPAPPVASTASGGPDRIRLSGVRIEACHGVLPEEKTTPAPFVVDVDLDVDLSWAGRSDDLHDTVNYALVAQDVQRIVSGPPVDLIEHLAERIADACLEREPVEAVTVTVHKPQAPVGVPFGDVEVRVCRERVRPVVVALGANLGDAPRTLAAAVRQIGALRGVRVRAVSPLFDTDPVGGPDQPAYVNAVLVGETVLTPRTLLAGLHRIEAAHGRVRDVRWGARTLDLDLIQCGDPASGGDVRSDAPALTLPHPRAHERGFVLLPWLAVDPAAVLRVSDDVVPVADLVDRLGDDATAGVRPGPAWDPTW